MKKGLGLILLALMTGIARAELRTETVNYKEGKTVLKGFLAYDDAVKEKRPAVIVVHEWKGLEDYAKSRAKQAAQLGYVAFAADIYGDGVTTTDPKEAGRLAGIYKSDRKLMRARIKAAFDAAIKNPMVDSSKVAAIGYCFGGTVVLELARSGAPVDGVVSFHGGLSTTMPAQKGKLNAKVLVLHGADDPYVPETEVLGFEQEMKEAGANWELVKYGNAVHAFTNPNNGTDNSKGAAYNEQADKRSWEAMKNFLEEIFE